MIKRGKLHKSEGYYCINKKRQGIFATHKKGVFKDKETEKEIPYHKVRITQIYKQKANDNISMTLQKPPRFIAFDPDMLKNLAELLGAIHEEIYGEPLYGGEIKEVKSDEPADEVDSLLAQLGIPQEEK
ncbi:hypothetical protein LCGC14_2241200 [marine sediment metagenome]|uniref:Uncharacterized protein n=1 Tax=marine sediment metagenome TaxID=412755 RepID=A0A0F9D556_9ZZZZ